jgi:tetratricopeptide (TPR) repeat protein
MQPSSLSPPEKKPAGSAGGAIHPSRERRGFPHKRGKGMQLSTNWQAQRALLLVALLSLPPSLSATAAVTDTEKKDAPATATPEKKDASPAGVTPKKKDGSTTAAPEKQDAAPATASEKSLFDKADAAVDAGDLKEAIEIYSQIVSINPHNADALANRGMIRFYKKEYIEAVADANEAIKYSPKWAYPHYLRGRCSLSLYNYKKAVTDFTRCLQLQDLKNAYLYRGQANFKLKEYSASLADLNQAINKDEKNWDAYYWRYWVYSTVKDLESARQDAEMLVKLQPKWGDSFRCLAYINEDQGKVPEAIIAYKQAAELYRAENDPADEQKMLENVAVLEKTKKEASAK